MRRMMVPRCPNVRCGIFRRNVVAHRDSGVGAVMPVSSVSPDKEGMGGVECDQLIGAIVIVGNCCSFVVRLLLFGFTIVIPCGSGELWETNNGVKY